MRCSGSDPKRGTRRTSVSDGSGVSRGDRNRNSRLARLREVVPPYNAIAGIDLADARQMVVVTDHESKVLARRVFQRRAWQLGAARAWAAGYAGVTVAVEPTGHRWRVVGQRATWRRFRRTRRRRRGTPPGRPLARHPPV